MKNLRKQLQAIARKRVLVGVPEDNSDRKNNDEMTNAGLAYLHTHGSPLQHIPARPIIEPALQAADNKDRITKILGRAAKAALDQKPDVANEQLNRAGVAGANAAKRWFVDDRNGWAPDSPETVARKGSDKPLIDTAQLRRSITYLVEEK